MRQIINESNNMLANALYEQIIRILKLMNKISIDSKEREEWLYVEQEKLIKEQRKLNENRQNIKPNMNKIPPNFKKKTNVAERSIFKKYKASDPISKEQLDKNACKECNLIQENWHTKARCTVQGLHLVVHHKRTKTDKPIFENGFTIVKDYRCRESPGFFWPLRVELMPTKDKLRNTIGYYVKRNEFGRKEWYANFFKRFKLKK